MTVEDIMKHWLFGTQVPDTQFNADARAVVQALAANCRPPTAPATSTN